MPTDGWIRNEKTNLITDLKELEKFFKLCRKQGVKDISFDGVSVKFGDLPTKLISSDETEDLQTETLTDEDLMFLAVQGRA